jgi:hypothetical protein
MLIEWLKQVFKPILSLRTPRFLILLPILGEINVAISYFEEHKF